MAITSPHALRLIVDNCSQGDFAAGPRAVVDAQRAMRAAIDDGALNATVYEVAGQGTEGATLVFLTSLKQRDPKAFFRHMARSRRTTFRLPDERYANKLFDAVFTAPRGRLFLRDLSDKMHAGAQRTAIVRDLFTVHVTATHNGTLQYRVAATPGHSDEFIALVRDVAESEPERPRRTPRFASSVRGRTRGLSR